MMNELNLLYLSRKDVETVALELPTIIKQLESAFTEKGQGKVELPPKPGIHTQPDAFIHAMPCYIPSLNSAGMKWVSGYPANQKIGLPYISGLLILNDDKTGFPIAVMDCTWITAWRTGAATALSAKYLARPESEIVGIIACGVQGETNLKALATLFRIKRVYAYDINADAQEKFIKRMINDLNIEVIGVTEPKAAVIKSDIVVTSGPILKHPTPVIEADWLQPGCFASAVDFDSYWTASALKQMDKLATDDTPQFDYYRSVGYFQFTPSPYADLGEIVTGLKPGRQTNQERIIAMNLGLAMDDMAVAPEIYRRALQMGLGVRLPL